MTSRFLNMLDGLNILVVLARLETSGFGHGEPRIILRVSIVRTRLQLALDRLGIRQGPICLPIVLGAFLGHTCVM